LRRCRTATTSLRGRCQRRAAGRSRKLTIVARRTRNGPGDRQTDRYPQNAPMDLIYRVHVYIIQFLRCGMVQGAVHMMQLSL
jgi:hypothetical protein